MLRSLVGSEMCIRDRSNIESTALGACIVSQISEGLSINDINSKIEHIYEADAGSADFYNNDYLAWKEYIERTISNIK